VPRRRPGAGNPVRSRDVMGGAGLLLHQSRHWPRAGGNRTAGRAAHPDVTGHRDGSRAENGHRLSALSALTTARGIIRSLRIYSAHKRRAAAMDRLYGQFMKPGDLAFDVGAHVGARVASFLRLGARVVAVEPQPAIACVLKLIYGWRGVAVETAAVGREAG